MSDLASAALQAQGPAAPKRRYTLYTALLAAGMMFFIYLLLGIWPFGDGTVVTGDLGGLYINFYAHLKEAIWGNAGFFYGFDKGLGGNLVGLYAYYYAGPLNVLYALFPLRWFPVTASILLFAKVVLTSVLFRVFIAYKVPKLGWRSVALSLCYGFMAYVFVYAQNPMWHDVLMLLPLVCLGIERIIAGKPLTFYAIALAVTIFSDFYIAFMACLFAVLYFLWAMLLRPAPHAAKDWRGPLLRFGVGSLLAGGANAALLVPALVNINQNKGDLLSYHFVAETYFPLYRLPERLLWGSFDAADVSGQVPFLYCGIAILLLVLCYFVSRAVSLREKLVSGGVVLVFLLSFWIKGLDYIWHGLKEPVWFPARYSFAFCFFLIVLAARAFALRAVGRREVLVSGGVLLAAMVVMTIFPQAVSRSRMLLNEGLALAYVFVLMVWTTTGSRVRKRVATGVLALVVAGELALNGYYVTDQFDMYLLSDYQRFVDEAGGTVEAIEAADEGDYRIAENFFRSLNDPMLLGYRGMSHFASTQDSSAQAILYNLGYRNYQAAGPYMLGGTAFADAVLGYRYLINTGMHELPPHWQQAEDIYAPHNVLQNPCALPMVFAVDAGEEGFGTAHGEDFEEDLFAFSNDFYRALGGEGDIFAPVADAALVADGEELPLTGEMPVGACYEITAAEEGWHYAYFASDKVRVLHTIIDGVYSERYFSPTYSGAIALGWLEAGQTVTVQWELTEDIPVQTALFARLDEEKLQDLTDDALQNAGDFAVEDGQVNGSVTVDAAHTTLYTSIPWDDGWRATVNGQRVEAERFMGGLLAVPLEEGENTVELNYVPPGSGAGLAITLVCLPLLAGAIVAERVLRRRRRAGAAAMGEDAVAGVEVANETTPDTSGPAVAPTPPSEPGRGPQASPPGNANSTAASASEDDRG